jgi:hypothetical protein
VLAPPRNSRETSELLAQLDDTGDLNALLDQVEWAGVGPIQIYQAMFDRLPEKALLAVPSDGYSARKHAQAALTSPEYQKGIRERLLMAFPEKRRIVFVHIPKCAGTDLYESLSRRFPRLYEDLSERHWINGAKFFLYLRNFVIKMREFDSIFVHGHVPLVWYLDRELLRYTDHLFTVVREPLSIVISQVNYVFKRFFEAPLLRDPDNRIWGNALGIEIFDRETPHEKLIEMGLRMLRLPEIVQPNFLCNYLGRGTAESAVDTAARCDIEITDTSCYSAWLAEKWGMQTTHANKSKPILSITDIPAADRLYLESITKEDAILYQRILHQLQGNGGSSIRGTELFKAVASHAKPSYSERKLAPTERPPSICNQNPL